MTHAQKFNRKLSPKIYTTDVAAAILWICRGCQVVEIFCRVVEIFCRVVEVFFAKSTWLWFLLLYITRMFFMTCYCSLIEIDAFSGHMLLLLFSFLVFFTNSIIYIYIFVCYLEVWYLFIISLWLSSLCFFLFPHFMHIFGTFTQLSFKVCKKFSNIPKYIVKTYSLIDGVKSNLLGK